MLDKIGVRLLGSYLLIVLFFALCWGYCLHSTDTLRAASAHRVTVDDAALTGTLLFEKLMDDRETGLRGYLLTGDHTFLQPWTAASRSLPAVRRDLDRVLVDGDAGLAQVQAMRRAAVAWSDWAARAMAAPSTPPVRLSVRLDAEQRTGKRLFDVYRRATAGVLDALSARRAQGLQADAEAIRRMDLVFTALLGCSIVGAIYLAVRTTRAVTRPLRDLASAAEAFGHGDLVHPIAPQRVREFQALAARMTWMRDELAATLRNLDERTALLERTSAEQKAFLYMVSHDLKTPLVSLHAMAAILMDEYGERLDEDGRHYLTRILANAQMMMQLQRDLIDLVRIGRGEDSRTLVDLCEVIAGVTETLQPALQARGGAVDVQGHVPPVLADKTRLTQVFANLIENAVAYTPPERAPRIAIELRADDEHAVEVTVSDNGVGIPAAMHDKVFEIFQRLPTGKRLNPQGTGAGLAIVARIVETHGGAIRVDSRDGAGATFRIHLPRGRAA